MRRRIVGITASTEASKGHSGTKIVSNLAYARAVELAGGVPFIIPVTESIEQMRRLLDSIDGLLLSGGADVAPRYYGSEPVAECGAPDELRDSFETLLVKTAIQSEIPILAICRGMQLLNVVAGGTLYQDLPTERPSNIQHRQQGERNQPTHPIMIKEGSLLEAAVGVVEMKVNSLHHQAVRDLAPGYVVTATATDGVIEGMEHPDRPGVIAVQFHPEELAPQDPHSRRLFSTFISII